MSIVINFVSLGQDAVAALLLKHERDLLELALAGPAAPTLEAVSQDQHALISNGAIIPVHRLVGRVMCRLSIATSWLPYCRGTSYAQSASLVRLVLGSEESRRRERAVEALQIYARPVAVRWRRVCRLVRWIARIRRWLPIFNETAYNPDSVAAKAAAERFRTRASSSSSSSSLV